MIRRDVRMTSDHILVCRLTVVDSLSIYTIQSFSVWYRAPALVATTSGTRVESIGCGLVEKGQVEDQVKCQDRK